MQIVPAPSNLLSALAAAGQGKTAENGAVPHASPRPQAVTPAVDEAPPSSTTVTLSAAPPPVRAAAPVYAEIWLDGHKVGEVYTDGQAALPGIAGGLNLLNLGSGLALAHQRAEEIARLTGAEVRYSDPVDLQTERTRTQLRKTYREF